ncbi:MAG: DUF3467 domain-containing protein [Armatimonadota bacterium]|jgi:hypothetical protein
MAQEQPDMVELTVTIEPMDAPDITDVYANIAGIGMGSDDLVLVFARAFPGFKAGQKNVKVRPSLRVTLPPRVAGILAQNILRMLQARFGTVPDSSGGGSAVPKEQE